MSYTHVSRLTTVSEATFSTADEWLEAHGLIGQDHDMVTDFSVTLEDDNRSVVRTMVYASEADRAAHVASKDGDNPLFTGVVISE